MPDWVHVNLDAGTAYVEVWRSVREGGDTKTKKSKRTLAIPEFCVEALRRQRAQQAAERLVAGDRWLDTGLVFTTAFGTAMDAANARRYFRRALRLVPGLAPDDWTPRELRHSFVSLLSNADVPVEQISQLVGHRGTTVTELVHRHQLKPVLQTGATRRARRTEQGRDRRMGLGERSDVRARLTNPSRLQVADGRRLRFRRRGRLEDLDDAPHYGARIPTTLARSRIPTQTRVRRSSSASATSATGSA